MRRDPELNSSATHRSTAPSFSYSARHSAVVREAYDGGRPPGWPLVPAPSSSSRLRRCSSLPMVSPMGPRLSPALSIIWLARCAAPSFLGFLGSLGAPLLTPPFCCSAAGAAGAASSSGAGWGGGRVGHVQQQWRAAALCNEEHTERARRPGTAGRRRAAVGAHQVHVLANGEANGACRA